MPGKGSLVRGEEVPPLLHHPAAAPAAASFLSIDITIEYIATEHSSTQLQPLIGTLPSSLVAAVTPNRCDPNLVAAAVAIV